MDIKKIIINRGIIKKENGGWGRIVLTLKANQFGEPCAFQNVTLSSLAVKLFSTLVTLRGFAAMGCWVLFHSHFSPTTWGVCL